ncbi:hypothetical protein B0H17DRAFT_1125362 [Mycena rosella]|uniref:Uncharacterized protein n=1 Tax=Mycena rosella TaxID=1033263 RepID=A0AAD7MA66_MYCRO|nr:hypothetical protein B0H17DRAFT_1125362 [Mycena rosella]
MTALPNLATQLNDLAVANADGLLNDDEYRLLRQNLFERYSGGAELLSVDPTPVHKLIVSAPPRRKHAEVVEQPIPRGQVLTTPTRTKGSAVAGFLRRATGRKSPAPTNAIKLSLPRMFSKKPESASSSDTDSSVTRISSSPSFRKRSNGDLPSKPQVIDATASPTRPKADATSPTRPNFDAPFASPSRSVSATVPQSRYDVVPGGSNDIFDDDNLQTSEDIRSAIAAVEADARRLVTAFNDLETSAVIRYRQEHPQRQRSGSSTTTTSAGLRRPSATPLSAPTLADAQSVGSSNSLRTTKSTASLFHNSAAAPPSAFSQSTPPLSATSSTPPPPATSSTPPPTVTSAWASLSPRRLPSLRRKASTSSVSTQGTSSLLGVRSATSLSRASSMSRSASHLPLPVPATKGTGSTMMELLNHKHTPAGEGGQELAEVRRRRAEMMGRCEARLEYLRAKLKGAQIRERLLKK